MRGQTVYDRRGMPLALPSGTLENPALRFARERMGLYRQGAGHLGIGINRFRAIDVAATDTFIRSNSPGATTVVAPLAIARANATTAPLQETALDVYEIGAPVARMAAYRETDTRWGWKLYSFNGPTTPVLLLGVAGTGAVTIPGALTVGGAVTLQGSLSLAGGAALDPPIGIGGAGRAGTLLSLYPAAPFPTGVLQGATTNHWMVLQNAAPGGAPTARGVLGLATGVLGGGPGTLLLYTDGATPGDLILGRASDPRLALTAAATILSAGGVEHLRITAATGYVGIGTASPGTRLHVVADGAALTISNTSATPANCYMQVQNFAGNRFLQWGLAGGPGQFLAGSVVGDAAMMSVGGRLLLGGNTVTRLILDNAVGIQFMDGGTERMRLTTGGFLGINIASPSTHVQLQVTAAGHGLSVTAPAASPTFSPMIALWDHPSTPTRQALLALSLSTGHFGFGAAGDLLLSTIGAGAGRTVLGTGGAARLIVGLGGNVSVGGLEGSSKFNVMQSANALGGSLRVWHTDATHYADFYCDPSYRAVIGANGYNHLFFAVASGYATFGPAATDGSRVHITQQSSAVSEGLRLTWGGGDSYHWIDVNGYARWGANANSGVMLMHGASYFCPPGDQVTVLGHPGLRWAHLYTVHAQFDGNAQVAGTLVVGGGFSAGAVTTPSLQVNANANVAGTLTAAALAVPTLTPTTLTASGTITGAVINGASGTIGGLVMSGRNITTANIIMPTEAVGGSIGDGAHWFGAVFCNAGYKPGGGDWQTLSDRRTKVASAERPYERGLADLLQLKPVRYRYNGRYGTVKDSEYAGFGAEDLQRVAPEMVRTLRLARAEGDDEEEILTVDTSDLKLMLLNAIRELHERLAAVEGKVA